MLAPARAVHVPRCPGHAGWGRVLYQCYKRLVMWCLQRWSIAVYKFVLRCDTSQDAHTQELHETCHQIKFRYASQQPLWSLWLGASCASSQHAWMSSNEMRGCAQTGSCAAKQVNVRMCTNRFSCCQVPPHMSHCPMLTAVTLLPVCVDCSRIFFALRRVKVSVRQAI